MANKEADETLRIGNDIVTLYIGTAMVSKSPGDRMFVQRWTDQQEEVLVFRVKGERTVAQVVQTINLTDTRLAVHVDNGPPSVAELPKEDEKRLLAVYDLMQERSFK